jgi:hypothetical protein
MVPRLVYLAGCRKDAILLMMGLLIVSLGCQRTPKLAAVSGRVTYEGEPVSEGAAVLFSDPERGIFITAKMDSDGRYRVEMAEGYGLPPGSYGVALVPPMLMMTPEMEEKYREGGPPPALVAFPKIPLRYRKPETSSLRLELTPEGATFDIEMVPD